MVEQSKFLRRQNSPSNSSIASLTQGRTKQYVRHGINLASAPDYQWLLFIFDIAYYNLTTELSLIPGELVNAI